MNGSDAAVLISIGCVGAFLVILAFYMCICHIVLLKYEQKQVDLPATTQERTEYINIQEPDNQIRIGVAKIVDINK